MHVLATELASLDEVDVAVDLGQSPAEVVVLSFSDTDLSALAAAWQRDVGLLPTVRLASLKRLRHPMSVDLYLESVVSKAKAVIVRCLGGLDYWRYGLERIADLARDNGILFAALPGDDRADQRLASMSTVAASDLGLLDRFFREGGADNLNQALRLVGARLGGELSWQPPVAIGPLTVLGDANNAGPTALVVFYRANLLAADIEPITALMAALERHGLAPLGVAVSSLKDPAVESELTRLIETHPPAIILNTTAFSAMRDDDTTVLDVADAAVLQVVLAGSTREAWSESGRGLSPSDLAMNVVLPELDGRLLTRAISFKAEADADPRLEFAAVRHVPDASRVEYVARLASAWAALRGKEPSERRLALVLSDYPARGGRTGYAVGLDTTGSTLEILRLLREAGYDVGGRDWQAADIAPLLDRTVRHLRCGKVIVLLQPDRGGAYHDVAAEPHPDYVAAYTWLREVEKIDALIHLGTHGTLEWLPGKALALSAECWPEKVLGPVPVVYPFIVNNPGEAAQAKRRLTAVTIGHLTPPLSAAGLNGPLADLEGLIDEYAAADGLDARRLRHLGDEIVERAWSNGLAADCGLVRGEFDARCHRQARRPALRHQGSRGSRQAACLRLWTGRGLRTGRAQRTTGGTRRPARGAWPGGRAEPWPGRRVADRPQPHLDRSARHSDAHRRCDRRTRGRRGRAPLSAGSWRASAHAGDRPVGLGLVAHRRRRPRPGAGLSRREAGVGSALQSSDGHRGDAARHPR